MPGKVKLLTDFLKLVSGSGGSSKTYVNWMPQKVCVVSAGEGSCVCEVTVDEDLVDVNNQLHGSCTASLVDMATCLALMTSKNSYPGVSVELSVSYVSAAKLGEDVVIDAKTVKWGRNVAFLHANVRRKSDGAVIAVGKHTQYVTEGAEDLKKAIAFVKNNM